VTRGLNRFETFSVALAVIIAAAAGALALASVANTAVFIVSAAALVALAWIVGVATEQLGASAGPKVGGVLNATFGNAAELIITIFAIRAGSWRWPPRRSRDRSWATRCWCWGRRFSSGPQERLAVIQPARGRMNASMLALAAIGLGIPTLFGHVAEHADVQAVSDITAGILLTLYVLMLVFYFRTPEVAHVSGHEPVGPHWPGRLAMLVLLLSTGSVAVISDVFVGTLDAVISDIGISAVFLGLIIVPLVGNIAENIVGIKIAYQNDMDFSMLVSLGSSLQIALGVAPALVFISLLTPHHFDLLFPVMQVVSLAAAVFITALIAADGESNWLEGAQLMAVYGIIATAVWYL